VLGAHISQLCKRNRIPVNVADSPSLCTFSLLSTHTDGPLQIGVTTNGRGCKLSSRIRREIASSLPPQLGPACVRLGTIRRRIQEEDHLSHIALAGDLDLDEEESIDQTASFNKLVTEADLDAAKNRRIRWLSQICEYWPLRRLANITDKDVDSVLKSYAANPETSVPLDTTQLDSRSEKRGKIILAGSGPGHPDLLTRATHKAILTADVILADKLVPSGVLDLIPRRTPVHIARKFPGNAERAQEELLELGLAGLKSGKTVLRLKQGDPYIYGRGGEEFEYFRKEGYGNAISVLPGITSALSAPLFAGIPATQRAVSDQVLICTGTGRKGKPTVPPEFVDTRTVVFLMALHRITGLVADLTTWDSEDPRRVSEDGTIDRSRKLWPKTTPCAVIERASCPDQRVIRTTLEFVAAAIEEEGSRPPGLLVLGVACEVLYKSEAGRKWTVEEGLKGFEDFGSVQVGLEELVVGEKTKAGGNCER
jgi:uroporphyrin-III C-methyltransferase